MPLTVLLAADDSDRWDGLDDAIRCMQLCVRRVGTGEEALELNDRMGPGLVLVSTDLPDVHALDVCRRIRKSSDVPLIVLTSEAAQLDRILALELGADDVVSGACHSEELQERVKAALRRGAGVEVEGHRGDVLDLGGITLDRSSGILTNHGDQQQLTPMETELMWMLGQHAGEVVESGDILEKVWGYPRDIKTRTVDVHIGRLRRKLGDDGRNPRYIITVRSVGYRLEPPEDAPSDENDSAA
ncbi:MAG: winged helix-turn-helix domain-containing protein [Armatimonadota bacterium]